MNDGLLEKKLQGIWQYLSNAQNNPVQVTGTVEFRPNGQYVIDIESGGICYRDGIGEYRVENGMLQYSQLEEVEPGPALSPYFIVEGDTLCFLLSNPEVSNVLIKPKQLFTLQRIKSFPPQQLALPQQAYEALVRTMEQGDAVGVEQLCTPVGYLSLLHMQGEKNTADFFRGLGKVCAAAKVNWLKEEAADQAACSLFEGTKSTPVMYFLRTAEGWKLDKFEQGK